MQTEWILLARSKTEMEDWMDAISDQIHALFIRQYNVPGDDYWSQGWVNHAIVAVIKESSITVIHWYHMSTGVC